MVKEILEYVQKELHTSVKGRRVGYGDQSVVYVFQVDDEEFYVKVAGSLEREKINLQLLSKKLPVPRAVGFNKVDGQDVLITTAISGKNLAELCGVISPERVMKKMAEATKAFHDITRNGESQWIHGDACLPNFIFDVNNTFAGYVDLGEARVGPIEEDLSAAIWSLEKNLGKGYGSGFLEEYGYVDTSESAVNSLFQRYVASA